MESTIDFFKKGDSKKNQKNKSNNENLPSSLSPKSTPLSSLFRVFSRKSRKGSSRVRPESPSPEGVTLWFKSFDNLLHDEKGLELFKQYLRSEFSDENLEFWVACEEFKSIPKQLLEEEAHKIFNDFVMIQAPRQINLESKTREITSERMKNPNEKTFEEAQKRIQALMARDSYPRFLQSEFLQNWLQKTKLKINI